MKGRNVSQRPRWQAEPQAWQAKLFANPHLTPGEKLTAVALSKRFTGWGAVDVNLDEIARETGQTVAEVRSHIEHLNGVAWEVVP